MKKPGLLSAICLSLLPVLAFSAAEELNSGRGVKEASPPSPAIARAIQSVAQISLAQPADNYKDFKGTGFLIGDGFLATNFHVISESKDLGFRIQTNSGVILPFLRIRHLSAIDDLAVLEVENPGLPHLEFAPPLKIDKEVHVLGFLESGLFRKIRAKTLSGNRSQKLFLSFLAPGGARIQKRSGNRLEYLLLSPPEDMRGFSGGPIVNNQGELAGVFSDYSRDIGSGASASRLRALLLETALPRDKSKKDLIIEEKARLLELAALGHAKAQQRLGLALFQGLGTERDLTHPLAFRWFRKAAEQGLPASQYNLGMMLLERGYPGEAFSWFLSAANQDYVRAQYQTGLMLSDGLGVEKNPEEALKQLEAAAERGLPLAQFKTAGKYFKGQGAPPSQEKAFKWFLSAAQLGHIEAQGNAGVMYLQGWGTEKNLKEAYYWFRKAADQGDANSQHNIGVMYLHGIYLEKNEDEGRYWLLKAAEQGFDAARQALEEIDSGK